MNRDTVFELTRVLQYPEFRLDQPDQHELLGDYLPFTEDWPEPDELIERPAALNPPLP